MQLQCMQLERHVCDTDGISAVLAVDEWLASAPILVKEKFLLLRLREQSQRRRSSN